jgi:hypothetical protein
MAVFHPGHLHTLLNSNSPTDVPEEVGQLVDDIGMVRYHHSKKSNKFNFSYATLIITGIVFMLVVSWFDFLQTSFYFWYKPGIDNSDVGPAGVFWFCVMATLLGILIITAIRLW